MRPLWEIYQVEDVDSQPVWVLDGPMLNKPMMFVALQFLYQYMESFHENKLGVRSVTKVRSGDSSTPKHPYDRPDGFWEAQDGSQ